MIICCYYLCDSLLRIVNEICLFHFFALFVVVLKCYWLFHLKSEFNDFYYHFLISLVAFAFLHLWKFDWGFPAVVHFVFVSFAKLLLERSLEWINIIHLDVSRFPFWINKKDYKLFQYRSFSSSKTLPRTFSISPSNF